MEGETGQLLLVSSDVFSNLNTIYHSFQWSYKSLLYLFINYVIFVVWLLDLQQILMKNHQQCTLRALGSKVILQMAASRFAGDDVTSNSSRHISVDGRQPVTGVIYTPQNFMNLYILRVQIVK